MENKDFDKIFAHKFKQIPGEPYHEQGWSDLSGRMDAYERRNRRWLFPVLLPLFGLLTAGNIFWWHQWRELERRHSQEAGSTTTMLKPDTIVRARVVYRYDTIYQNITLLRKYAAGGITINEQATATGNTNTGSISVKHSASGTTGTQQQPVAGSETASAQSNANTQNTNERPIKDLGQSIENKLLTPENTTEPAHTVSHRVPLPDSLSQVTQPLIDPANAEADSTFEFLLQNPPVTEKVRKPLLMFARPRLNLSVGWGNPLLEHKHSGYLFGAGIGADVALASHIRLGADAYYWKGQLKADEIDELKGVEIPNPGSDYKLKYWETYHLPVVTYEFHLRYLIPLKKTWIPWLGVGTQAVTYLPYEIEFDFENQNNQVEYFIQSQAGVITHWHGIMAMLGIEGQISPHFSLGAEGYLLRHIGKKPGVLDNQVGLKTRLYYNF